ncbi:hypothetical protein [Pseudomonas sp. PD9R]|uniref:hypothetical protein n=1 Tax=Pseudomonas sp. PD9R TaxID=2853534 RepID=UPI001C443B5B|nr:hypothetical protein [Pseudomonas sp. PD9R]MBV6826312.1 hypothetical protein [Pseudomonas sp. PD9R]
MKLSSLLIPFTALVASFSASAAAYTLPAYAACDENSLAIIQSPLFKDLVPSNIENGQIKLSGGTKNDMGQRWMFAKPVVVDGMTLTGFFAEDIDLMGTRIINWGFYAEQTPAELRAQLAKVNGPTMEAAGDTYAHAEIWSHSKSAWQLENAADNSGKLVIDTAERVFLIEPAPGDLPKTNKGMLNCSIQGKVNPAMLNTSRPDLASTAR